MKVLLCVIIILLSLSASAALPFKNPYYIIPPTELKSSNARVAGKASFRSFFPGTNRLHQRRDKRNARKTIERFMFRK